MQKTDHAYKQALDHSPEQRTVLRRPETGIPSRATLHDSHIRSSLLGESLGEALHVALERTVVGEELNIGTVQEESTGGLLLQVLVAAEGSEAPVLGDDDLLPAGELVLGAAEGLESGGLVWRGLLAFPVQVSNPEG